MRLSRSLVKYPSLSNWGNSTRIKVHAVVARMNGSQRSRVSFAHPSLCCPGLMGRLLCIAAIDRTRPARTAKGGLPRWEEKRVVCGGGKCIRAVCRKIDVRECVGPLKGRGDDHPRSTFLRARGMPYKRVRATCYRPELWMCQRRRSDPIVSFTLTLSIVPRIEA